MTNNTIMYDTNMYERPWMIIMRGLPGSGKSTWIELDSSEYVNQRDFMIASADHYHIDENGVYNFDLKNQREAHTYCKNVALYACKTEHDVYIDNTNTQRWEFQYYLSLAKKYKYNVRVVRIHGIDPETAFNRNVHGVPMDTLIKMNERFEDFEGEEIFNAKH